MELLLNLLWVMLTLPAIWVWRRESIADRNQRCLCHTRSLVLLGCVLVILFPVVSATDDLHAMRPEVEESSSSKRLVKQSLGAKSPAWSSDGVSPAALVQFASFGRNFEQDGVVLSQIIPSLEQATSGAHSGRAPPLS